LRLIYESVQGPFRTCIKEILIAALAVVRGNWLGQLLRLQKMSNRIGHRAATLLGDANKTPQGAPGAGLLAATLLFCAAPLGLIGAVTDGLENYFYLLMLKAVMDGLAMVSFVKMFRWPVALAAIPVFLFFNSVGLAVQLGAQPWLDAHAVTRYVGLAAGIITCAVALVILEVRRVEMANYLPGLVVAPLLAHWLLG
jgi:hypothetical protein